MGPVIDSFDARLPEYEVGQDKVLEWLAEAHALAEETSQAANPGFDREKFRAECSEAIAHFGCKPTRLAKRRSAFRDFTHRNWEEMEIFQVLRRPAGLGLKARSLAYAGVVEPVFDALFRDVSSPPRDLIHVTCTGYLSPSAAQRLVERKAWQRQTTVTHAYHMGCYASIPALRIATGFLSSAGRQGNGDQARVDLVHTELCTLHLNPSLHSPEQIIVQSLFSDGFIRYSVSPHRSSRVRNGGGLEILALHEEICPESLEDMTWICSDWGMEMTLSREVPFKVAAGLRGFLERLFALAGLDFPTEKAGAVFAIHPGGPKVIDGAREFLDLRPEQVAFSQQVFLNRGNMSSATLPHIWQEIAHSATVPPGTLVVNLAFGPGLTFCGGIFRKVE